MLLNFNGPYSSLLPVLGHCCTQAVSHSPTQHTINWEGLAGLFCDVLNTVLCGRCGRQNGDSYMYVMITCIRTSQNQPGLPHLSMTKKNIGKVVWTRGHWYSGGNTVHMVFITANIHCNKAIARNVTPWKKIPCQFFHKNSLPETFSKRLQPPSPICNPLSFESTVVCHSAPANGVQL